MSLLTPPSTFLALLAQQVKQLDNRCNSAVTAQKPVVKRLCARCILPQSGRAGLLDAIHVWFRHTRLVFALFCCAISAAFALEDQAESRDEFRLLDWAGYNQSTELADGTFLYRYIAEGAVATAIDGLSAVHVRIAFVPRFACSAVISVSGRLSPDIRQPQRVRLVQAFNAMEISIDNEATDFPVLVELSGSEIHAYLDADIERRGTLRLLMELGSQIGVQLGSAGFESMSLLGSKKAIDTASGRCRNHR